MVRLYQIELDRNERDIATFIKSRDISLSQSELRVLIASKAGQARSSAFDTVSFIKKLAGSKAFTARGLRKEMKKDQKAQKLSTEM